MRQGLCVSLVILALAVVLAACRFTSPPQKTPQTLESSPAPRATCMIEIMCVQTCVFPGMLEAWVDWNGNGNRDSDDEPLQGVRFRLHYPNDQLVPVDCTSNEPLQPLETELILSTDATGHDTFEAVSCSCELERRIEPETPVGYRLTSAEAKCETEYQEQKLNCFSYGFTLISVPTAMPTLAPAATPTPTPTSTS